MMQAMPAGSMLGVLLPQEELASLLESSPNLSVAAVNAPSTCVVSGLTAEIDALEQKLEGRNIPRRRLHQAPSSCHRSKLRSDGLRRRRGVT